MPEPITDHIRGVRKRARCLFSREQVQQALDDMARRISEDLQEQNPLILCVMTGALITVSELMLRLSFPLQVDYLHATRYDNKTVGDRLQWLRHPVTPLANRHVLVVDDILDQGATLDEIMVFCASQGVASVRSAVLLDKAASVKLSAIQADYVGLRCDDHYVFGYGMDYQGYLRNADGIYAVADSDLQAGQTD